MGVLQGNFGELPRWWGAPVMKVRKAAVWRDSDSSRRY